VPNPTWNPLGFDPCMRNNNKSRGCTPVISKDRCPNCIDTAITVVRNTAVGGPLIRANLPDTFSAKRKRLQRSPLALAHAPTNLSNNQTSLLGERNSDPVQAELVSSENPPDLGSYNSRSWLTRLFHPPDHHTTCKLLSASIRVLLTWRPLIGQRLLDVARAVQ